MPHERKLGTIVGPIILRDRCGTHDLRDAAWRGPSDGSANMVSVVAHDAAFMVLVEKDSIFNRLRHDQFVEQNRCIILSGNGYPGRSFRRIIHQLYEQLRIPLYVLADNDPAGYEFFFLVTRGSERTHGELRSTMAIPGAAFLGVQVRDFESLGLPNWVGITLSEAERCQLLRLKSCKWLQSDAAWQRELDSLLERGFKVEMEALYAISPSFMASSYLPDRLAARDHLLGARCSSA